MKINYRVTLWHTVAISAVMYYYCSGVQIKHHRVLLFNRPVVVEHHPIGRFIVAQTDVMVELRQLLAQHHQLVLSCIQGPLALSSHGQSFVKL